MLENVVISNPSNFEKLKEKFREGGKEKLHILSDFERTLTFAFVKGERVPSLISILRSNGKYLGKDYAKKAKELFEKFHPIEINSKIPIKEKKKAMEKWWTTHFNLLIKVRLNKKHLEKVINSGKIKLRKKADEFFNFLKEHKIPLVIISSSGLGEAIPIFLKKEGKLYPNVYFVGNSFFWDKKGNAIDVKKPIIHSMNKDETVLKDFPFYEKIKERKNVILLGDTLGDVEMVKGFDYDFVIKIGFLNENVKENFEPYKKIYDVLILNDGSMDFVNSLLKEIITKSDH